VSRFTPRARWKGTEPREGLSRADATADDLLTVPPGNGGGQRAAEPDGDAQSLQDRLLVEATRRGLVAALAGMPRTRGAGLIADSVGARPLDQQPLVSVVVPLRNEQFTLEVLYRAVRNVLEGRDLAFELIFVDDGSDDGSADVLRGLVAGDHRVRALRLRRNFGKAAALGTGFRAACGAWVVTLDADLQDDPEEIPRLLAKLCEGHDLVSGWKQQRRDPLGRRLASKTFNVATRAVSGVRLHDFNCGLKGYSRECAQELADSCYGEQHRYLPVIAHAKGFSIGELPVNHRERVAGRSRYGLERYVRGLLDLMTTVYLSRYARRPMHVFGSAGLLLLIPGAAAVLWLVFQKVALGASIGGRPLLILGAVMFLAGLQLILTGLVAEMVSRLPSLLARVAGDAPSFPTAAIYAHRQEPEAGPGEAADVVSPGEPVLDATVIERHGEPAVQKVQ
jgi:glycosyltransferase involved in cell wall biosynthesis